MKELNRVEGELLRAKKVLHVQEALLKEFASSTTLENTLQNILKTICSSFEWKCGIIWTYNHNQLEYLTGWAISNPFIDKFLEYTQNITFKPGEGIPGKILLDRKIRWFKNFQKYTQDERGEYAQKGSLNSVLIAPILYRGKLLGVIELLGESGERPSREFLTILRSLETHLGEYFQKRAADLRVSESEEKTKILVELGHAIIYTVNEEGIITSLNTAAENITGLKREDLIGKPLLNLICESDRERVKGLLEIQRKKQDIASVEAILITQGEGDLIAEIKEKPLVHPDGTVERLGVIRDITERYFLEKQKDLWVGIATHELKTPLTSIKAFSQIMNQKASKNGNAEFEEYLKRIDQLTNKMASLINDLLDVTKIRSGTLELNYETFSINKLLAEVLDFVQPISLSHHIVFEQGIDCYVNGDRQRIIQVFNNILSNAIKYSPKGTNIVVRTQSTENSVVISVQDYGPGIPKQNKDYIFDLFYRGGNKLQQKSSGLGLGLYICKAIVDAHRGKIWVNSKVGKGSTFFVELPCSTSMS